MDYRPGLQYISVKDNMYTLTEQDIKFLDGIAGRIETATKHDYARNLQTSQVEQLKVLYRKMYGTEYVGSSSCSTCQLRLLKKVGEWLEKRKVHEEPEPVLTINELEVQATNKDKKKTGRKKK